MGFERLDGDEASYERLQESVQSLPFLADKKMVVIERAGSNKQFAEKAADLLKELPETTDLIIVEGKLDKRMAYYKTLKKQPGYQEFNEMDENGLIRWLISAAREKGSALSSNDARYLLERAGPNQAKLANELEKLSIRAGEKISRNHITELTPQTPQSSIFDLLEAAFSGNKRRMLDLYHEQRVLKVEPQQIVAMLAWQLHILALVKVAGDRSSDAVAREAKLSPYVVKKTAAIARNISLAETRRLIAELLEVDRRLKSESVHADDVLQQYLLAVAS